MSDLTKILNNIHINNSENTKPQVEELRHITFNCLKDLQILRQDLTHAYIQNRHVVIQEDGEYLFKSEADVRRDNQNNLDLDKTQRKEEKILQNILKALSPNHNTAQEKEEHKSAESVGFFKKIANLITKLVSVFKSKDPALVDAPYSTDASITDPAELMQNNIEAMKLYQEELKSRSAAFKNLDTLQKALSEYKGRKVMDSKEYNKPRTMREKLASRLNSNKSGEPHSR